PKFSLCSPCRTRVGFCLAARSTGQFLPRGRHFLPTDRLLALRFRKAVVCRPLALRFQTAVVTTPRPSTSEGRGAGGEGRRKGWAAHSESRRNAAQKFARKAAKA